MNFKLFLVFIFLFLFTPHISYADMVIPGQRNDYNRSECLPGEILVECVGSVREEEDGCAQYRSSRDYRLLSSTGASFTSEKYCATEPSLTDRINSATSSLPYLVLSAFYFAVQYWYIVLLVLLAIIALPFLKRKNTTT